jgi:hypothetical protein
MADASDRPKAENHFLIDVENRDQQHQGPEQRGAVVLTGLGAECTGVIVADHDNEAWSQNREQGLQPCA